MDKLSRGWEILADFSDFMRILTIFGISTLEFCEWSQKYDYAGINFRECPKNVHISEIFQREKDESLLDQIILED